MAVELQTGCLLFSCVRDFLLNRSHGVTERARNILEHLFHSGKMNEAILMERETNMFLKDKRKQAG
jgi:hypothetical protein